MGSKNTTNSKEIYTRLINKAEDYIERNLKESICLADLAKNANLSDYHFHRMFKKYSSETVNEFVTRFKLERAAILLYVHPTISITDIAMDYGYSDSSTFSRTFKRHFGVSPIEYKKQQELTRNRKDSLS
jgi:AraC-like DNA-binding protein